MSCNGFCRLCRNGCGGVVIVTEPKAKQTKSPARTGQKKVSNEPKQPLQETFEENQQITQNLPEVVYMGEYEAKKNIFGKLVAKRKTK